MADFRVHHAGAPDTAGRILLSADESHHLVTVNRARVGDPVVAFNGAGREWTCELAEPAKRGALLQVKDQRDVPRPPFAITLAQAIPKGPAMEAIVRKATEIGAACVVPLETERTQVHFEAERGVRKNEKWHTAALEAAKQCGNPFLPEIRPMTRLDHFLATADSYDVKLIASLHPGARSLKSLNLGRAETVRRSAVWLIGPEGDFSPAEMNRALVAGFTPITLGPLVLRSETAAIYALSILSYELQAL